MTPLSEDPRGTPQPGKPTFNASLQLVAQVQPPAIPGGLWRWWLTNGSDVLASGETYQRAIATQQAAAAMAAKA